MWQGTTPVALKKLKSQEQLKEFESEATMLQSLTHPNVVQVFGIFTDAEGSKYLVTELLSKGNLQHVLLEHGSTLNQADLLGMARDSAAGMAYLHDQNVLHRDLSLSNSTFLSFSLY